MTRGARKVEPTSGLLDAASLKEAIGMIPTKMLFCRDWGHNWGKYHAADDGSEISETVRCLNNCGAEKTRYLSRDGYIVGSRSNYKKPEYLIKGMGRRTMATNAQIRVARLGR